MPLTKSLAALSLNRHPGPDCPANFQMSRLAAMRALARDNTHHRDHEPKKPVTLSTKEIIEISDDEARTARPRHRRRVSVSSESTSSESDQSSEPSDVPRPTRHRHHLSKRSRLHDSFRGHQKQLLMPDRRKPTPTPIHQRPSVQSAHPKPEYPKPEYPKPEYPKPEYPKPEYPKPEYPKPEYPKSKYPKPEYPKPEYPKPEYPKPEYPKPEYPKPEYPKPEYPKPEYPKAHRSFSKETGEGRRSRDGFIKPVNGAPSHSDRHPTSSTRADTMRASTLSRHISQRVRTNECPYYYDAKLDVKLYRGPGYERFPVVLGTVAGHMDICDKWNARSAEQKLREESTRPNHGMPMVSSSSLPISIDADDVFASDSDPVVSQDEQRCLLEVLQIFPQIQHRFVVEKYRQRLALLNGLQDGDMWEFPTSADVAAEIAELDKFPREEASKQIQKNLTAPDETGITIRWNKDVLKNCQYFKESIILLANEFNHVPTHYIFRTIHEKKVLFDAFIHLTDAEATYFTSGNSSRPYPRSRNPRVELEKKYQLGHNDVRDGHQYVSLVNELQAAKQHVAREALKRGEQAKREEQEAVNFAIHRAEGFLIECQCCFDDQIPINRAVSCGGDDIHFFCFNCVVRLAESQVGSMKYKMLCMDGSGCEAALSTDGIGQAVSIKIFDKLAFNQQQAEISAAGIEGLEQCPFCDFKAICDPVDVDSVFVCQNSDCGRSTCRKCREDSHLPQSCTEAKVDKGLSARHLVEEARSEAMMRPCPKCKVKIIKELGCNKMKCTTCGCLMCYVCKQDITTGKENGYGHFNGSGAKCQLYDQNGTDRHVLEADEAEREAIAKVKKDNGDIDEKVLRVETGPEKEKEKEKEKKRVKARTDDDIARRRHGVIPHRIDEPRAPNPPQLGEIIDDLLRDNGRLYHLARHMPPADIARLMYGDRITPQAQAQAQAQAQHHAAHHHAAHQAHLAQIDGLRNLAGGGMLGGAPRGLPGGMILPPPQNLPFQDPATLRAWRRQGMHGPPIGPDGMWVMPPLDPLFARWLGDQHGGP